MTLRIISYNVWFSGNMADTKAGSDSREIPSNVRPGGELSFFIRTSLENKDLTGEQS